MSLGHAIAVFAVSAYALLIIAVVLLPETRGRDLTLSIDGEEVAER
jgi:uncharacterized membrane protein